MATLTAEDIISGLERLGQLAAAEGTQVELLVMGGAVMAVLFQARVATRDVDVVIVAPREARVVRELVGIVAAERDWPEDWLNDGAKGYLVGISRGRQVLSAPGIEAWALGIPQLLAMKLSAWRDDVDVADARRLLEECRAIGDHEAVWRAIEPHLVPGDELKARYAFDDLWGSLHDDDTGVG